MNQPVLPVNEQRLHRYVSRLHERPSVPAFALVLLGIVGATLAVDDPGSRVAVPVLALACLLLTLVLLRGLRDRDARTDLSTIVLVALAIRLVAFIAVRQTVGPYVFGPDAWGYETVGREIVQAWDGLRALPTKVVGTLQVGYYYLNAVLQWVFGPAPAAPAVLNLYFGAWTTVPVYFLTTAVVRGNRGVARCAAALVALFPSLVLWSVLNLREAPTILLLVAALCFFVRVQERIRARTALAGLLCLAGVVLSREYLAVLVAVSVAIGLLMTRGKSRSGSMVGGLVLLTLLVSALGLSGFGSGLVSEPALTTVESLRQGLAAGARSAYGAQYDVSTVGGAVQFLPVGLAYYLLAPFPWELGSILQSVTIPEVLVWYALIPFALRGLYLGLRHDPRSFMVLLAVLVTITVAYALVQGNLGTAFRHRAQILPLCFVFTAIGLRDWYGWLVTARRGAAIRRSAASRYFGANAGNPIGVGKGLS